MAKKTETKTETTGVGVVTKTRKPRTKDNIMELFPDVAARAQRVKKVVAALKAIRKTWKIDGPTWPAFETADLIDALKSQVRPAPLSPSEVLAGPEGTARSLAVVDSEINSRTL